MDQMNLFGDSIPVTFAPTKSKRSYKDQFREAYGYNYDHKCGDCANCFAVTVGRRTAHKCKLLGFTGSEATDIRLSDVACGKWEECSKK